MPTMLSVHALHVEWSYLFPNVNIISYERITYSLLTMEKLIGPPVCVKNTGKVRNQWVGKCQFVVILFILVYKWSLYSTSSLSNLFDKKWIHVMTDYLIYMKIDEKQYCHEIVCSFLYYKPSYKTDVLWSFHMIQIT